MGGVCNKDNNYIFIHAANDFGCIHTADRTQLDIHQNDVVIRAVPVSDVMPVLKHADLKGHPVFRLIVMQITLKLTAACRVIFNDCNSDHKEVSSLYVLNLFYSLFPA